MKNNSFEINPLDVNIVKIQNSLIEKLNDEKTIYPFFEEYKNHDETLDFEKLILNCKIVSKAKFKIDITVFSNNKEYQYTYAEGSKKQVLEQIDSKNFFLACKELVSKISEIVLYEK